jgi:hypothetical protein
MVKPFIRILGNRRGRRPSIINADIQYLVYGEDEKKNNSNMSGRMVIQAPRSRIKDGSKSLPRSPCSIPLPVHFDPDRA